MRVGQFEALSKSKQVLASVFCRIARVSAVSVWRREAQQRSLLAAAAAAAVVVGNRLDFFFSVAASLIGCFLSLKKKNLPQSKERSLYYSLSVSGM